MVSWRFLNGKAAPAALFLCAVLTLVNGIQPIPLVRQEIKKESDSAPGDLHVLGSGYSVSHKGESLRSSSLSQSSGRSSFSTRGKSVRHDTRPAIVTFTDKECTNEIQNEGFFLPTNAAMKDRHCTWVALMDAGQNAKTVDSGNHTSMEWVCAESGKTMKMISHRNSIDCSSGEDDKWKVTINQIDYSPLQEGTCTQALMEMSDQTVYIKIMNHGEISEWPECMKDYTLIIYACIAGGCGLLLILLWIYCLIRSYRKKKKAKQEGMYGYPLMMGEKGKGFPPDFGKGKGGPDMFKGKPPGDMYKGKPGDKGKYGKDPKGKGKWGKAEWPVEAEPPPPEPAPLDITVNVISASNLRKADVTGSSDPFVECEILGKSDKKFKTPVVKKTTDPTWDFSERFKGFDEGDKMEFRVYDDDMGGAKKDLLGKALLPFKDVFPKGFEGELELTDIGDAKDSKLKVKIVVIQIMKKEEKKEDDQKKDDKKGEKKDKKDKKDKK